MNKLKWTSEILGKKVFMEAEFERIGKVRAKELLANQVGSQRVVQRAFVDRLKEAMANDEYIEDVINPIFISDTGKLLEGQHRLNAIADSEDGTSINFLVVRGLPEKAFVYLDQNRTRDAKDSLRIKGTRNPQKTAAASKLLYQLIYGKDSKPRNEIVDRMVDDYPALEEAVSLAESFSKKLHITSSVGAVLYFLYSTKYPEKWEKFYDMWLYGGKERRDGSHPVTRLVKKLNDVWASQGKSLAQSHGADYNYSRYKIMGIVHQTFITFANDKYKFTWDYGEASFNEVAKIAKEVVKIRDTYHE